MLRRLTHAARTKLWIALIMVISFPFLLCVAPLLWGWSSYVVLTGSMEDRVPSGSVVVTRPARMEDLQINTIVLFPYKTANVMHQITEVLPPSDPAAEWEINTQGSSNAKGDPIKVRYSELKGVYAWHIEYIGYAVQWIQRNMWMFAVVIGGGWLWLYRSASEPPS